MGILKMESRDFVIAIALLILMLEKKLLKLFTRLDELNNFADGQKFGGHSSRSFSVTWA
jgi:hypothetical protein